MAEGPGRFAPATLGGMGEAVSEAGKKVLAVGVLVLAAYLLFKLVLGFVMAVAWIAVVIVAVLAVIWAVRVL
jgi:hypothetical protein